MNLSVFSRLTTRVLLVILLFLLARAWPGDNETNFSSHLGESLDIQYFTGYERNPFTMELQTTLFGLSGLRLFPDSFLRLKIGDLKFISFTFTAGLQTVIYPTFSGSSPRTSEIFFPRFSFSFDWISKTRKPDPGELTLTKPLFVGPGVILVHAFAGVKGDTFTGLLGYTATRTLSSSVSTANSYSTTYSTETTDIDLKGNRIDADAWIRLGISKFLELNLSYDAVTVLNPRFQQTILGPLNYSASSFESTSTILTNHLDPPYFGEARARLRLGNPFIEFVPTFILRHTSIPPSILHFEQKVINYQRLDPPITGEATLFSQLDLGNVIYSPEDVELSHRGYSEFSLLKPGHLSLFNRLRFSQISFESGGIGPFQNTFGATLGLIHRMQLSLLSSLYFEREKEYVGAIHQAKMEVFLGKKRPFNPPQYLESQLLGPASAILGLVFWQAIVDYRSIFYFQIENSPFLFGRYAPWKGFEFEAGLGLSVKRTDWKLIESLGELDRSFDNSGIFPVLYLALRALIFQRILLELKLGTSDLGTAIGSHTFMSSAPVARLVLKGKF